MSRLKPLPPTLREKSRYVLFKIYSTRTFNRKEVSKAIFDAIFQFLGEDTASELSLWFIRWYEDSNMGILKVEHNRVDKIKTTLSLIKEISGSKVLITSIGVSGTLKKLRKKYLSKEKPKTEMS